MMIPTARVRTGKTGLTAGCFGTRHAVARAATQRRRAKCNPTRCVSSMFLPFPRIHVLDAGVCHALWIGGARLIARATPYPCHTTGSAFLRV